MEQRTSSYRHGGWADDWAIRAHIRAPLSLMNSLSTFGGCWHQLCGHWAFNICSFLCAVIIRETLRNWSFSGHGGVGLAAPSLLWTDTVSVSVRLVCQSWVSEWFLVWVSDWAIVSSGWTWTEWKTETALFETSEKRTLRQKSHEFATERLVLERRVLASPECDLEQLTVRGARC
jgi:hypothetical protein